MVHDRLCLVAEPELGEDLQRLIAAGAIVFRYDALKIRRNVGRTDLLVEVITSFQRMPVRIYGKSVLHLARDAVFARDDLGGLTHAKSARWIRESQQQADAGGKIRRTKRGKRLQLLVPFPGLVQPCKLYGRAVLVGERILRHALGSADNKDRPPSRCQFLISLGNGFHA